MRDITIGFAMCGSFCTLRRAIDAMEDLICAGVGVLPIMSETAAGTDTRFGKAADFVAEIKLLSACEVVTTVAAAEPIGPQNLCELLVVAPCTTNTLAKLALGITDSAVTMAAKSMLRNDKPVVLAVSGNDALGAGFKNLALLSARKSIFFVPMIQDDPHSKPYSLAADYSLLSKTILAARQGEQLRPMFK